MELWDFGSHYRRGIIAPPFTAGALALRPLERAIAGRPAEGMAPLVREGAPGRDARRARGDQSGSRERGTARQVQTTAQAFVKENNLAAFRGNVIEIWP